MRWLWLPLLALAALLLSPVTAQPVITGWRPPTGCSSGQVIQWNGSTWTCGATFSTNNVIPKGNGTTLTSSSWTDDGTTSTTTGALTANGTSKLGNGSTSTLVTMSGEQVYALGDTLGFRRTVDSDTTGYINYYGYNSGHTRFRDLIVADGKGATVATFAGSAKSLCVGSLNCSSKFNVNGVTDGQTDGAMRLVSHKNSWGNITSILATTAGGSTTTDNLRLSVDSGSVILRPGSGADALTVAHDRRTSISAALSDGTTFTHTLKLINTTADNAARLAFEDGTTGAVEATINGSRVSGGGGYLAFYTRASGDGALDHRLRIERDGDVCIGSTSCSNRLDVTGNTRVAGDLLTTGNNTFGDASGDVLDVNGNLSKFGGVADGQTYINENTISFEYANNSNATGYINYAGYQNGFTQFRDLVVADGKGATVATFAGGTKTTTLSGPLTSTSGVNTFGQVRGNTQTVSSTGALDLTLNADTTVLEFTGGSQIDLIGISGGAAGRIVFVQNTGAGNLFVYQEHATPAAANRIKVDANTGSRLVVNSFGTGFLIYNATQSRWFFYETTGFNEGPKSINGAHSITGNATIGDASGDTHTVNGGMTITNGLTVNSSGVTVTASGLSVQGGTAQFDQLVVVGAKVNATGTDPTLSSCGTSPSMVGSDTAGVVTVGTSPGATCTITFSSAFSTNQPACVITSHMSAAPTLFLSASSTSAITVSVISPVAAFPASGKFSYHCIGVP